MMVLTTVLSAYPPIAPDITPNMPILLGENERGWDPNGDTPPEGSQFSPIEKRRLLIILEKLRRGEYTTDPTTGELTRSHPELTTTRV